MADPAGYQAAYPDCELMLADLDCNGEVKPLRHRPVRGPLNPRLTLRTMCAAFPDERESAKLAGLYFLAAARCHPSVAESRTRDGAWNPSLFA